ncbi:MAG: hypothetical protein ACLSIL_16805 [Enterococcus casseliflavus]
MAVELAKNKILRGADRCLFAASFVAVKLILARESIAEKDQ